MVTAIIRPSRDKKGYRLRCRFKTDPYPSRSRIDREKVTIAEKFVADMHKQGWEHDIRFGFTMTGPWPMVQPVTVHRPRMLTAQAMLPYVANGARFLDQGLTTALEVPQLSECSWWEYEISGVFVRSEILTERPDPGEEED